MTVEPTQTTVPAPAEPTTVNTGSEPAPIPAADSGSSPTPPVGQPAAASPSEDGVGLDGKAEGGVDAQPSGNEWFGAPEENYSAEGIELPEGREFDVDSMNALAAVCGEMGLSQKAYANIVMRMTPVFEQAQERAVTEFRNGNLEALRSDEELGGANSARVMGAANKVYAKYVSPELQTMLSESGLNTHPEVVRLFYKLSQVLSDDQVVRGGQAAKPSLANFFNNSSMR